MTVLVMRTRFGSTMSISFNHSMIVVIIRVVLRLEVRVLQVGELPLRSGSPSAEESAAMSAVRSLTNETSVIASNFGICGLDDCSRDDYRRLFIPAIAKRASYVVASPETLNKKLPAEVLSRLEIALAWAMEPQQQAANLLAKAGVTHYLLAIDKEQASYRAKTLGDQAEVIFQNESFVLFRLIDSHQ